MNKVKTFVKKYWVTVLIFAGMVGLYFYSTEFGNANPFLFPKVWMGFIFMVIVLVVVMTMFEKLKTRLLRWTIS